MATSFSPPRSMLSHGDLDPPKPAAASTHGPLPTAAPFLPWPGASSMLTGGEGCLSGLLRLLPMVASAGPGSDLQCYALQRLPYHSDHTAGAGFPQRAFQVSCKEIYSTSFSMSREKRCRLAPSRAQLIIYLIPGGTL